MSELKIILCTKDKPWDATSILAPGYTVQHENVQEIDDPPSPEGIKTFECKYCNLRWSDLAENLSL